MVNLVPRQDTPHTHINSDLFHLLACHRIKLVRELVSVCSVVDNFGL